jgi:hypothetical protein
VSIVCFRNDTTTYITEPIDMSSSSLESSEVGIGGVDALTYSESDSGSSSGSDESLDDGAPSLQFGDDSPKKKKEKEKPQKQQQNQLTSQKRLPPPPPSTPASSPVGDDENDDHGDHQDVASRGNMSDSTVPKANAFDLIALSGAFDLSKLFAKKSSADLNFAGTCARSLYYWHIPLPLPNSMTSICVLCACSESLYHVYSRGRKHCRSV